MRKISSTLAAILAVTFCAAAAMGQTPTSRSTVKLSDDPRYTLDRSLPDEIKFQGLPLSDVFQFMRDLTGMNFVVDWKQLEKGGIKRGMVINLKVPKVKISDALQVICDHLGKDKVVYRPLKSMVLISSKEGADRLEKAIGVDTTKWDHASMTLAHRTLPEVTFDHVGLSDVVDFLNDVSGTKIDVDWTSLEKAGIDKNAPIDAKLRNIMIGNTLAIIFQSLTDTPIVLSGDKGILHVAAVPPTDKPAGEGKK